MHSTVQCTCISVAVISGNDSVVFVMRFLASGVPEVDEHSPVVDGRRNWSGGGRDSRRGRWAVELDIAKDAGGIECAEPALIGFGWVTRGKL